MSAIRVLVVEDNPLIAADIEQCLTNINFHTVATAFTVNEAISELAAHTPDIVLLDINLGEERDGIDIAKIIAEKYQIPFIYITSYSDNATIERAKPTKPAGYIIKPFDERDLLAAIEIGLYNFSHRAITSKSSITIEIVNKHISDPLTLREFEVLQAIYEGKTNQQMSKELFISINTVKTHIANLYEKLNVASRTAAIALIRTWL